MRSYHAARSLFSFLSFVAWALIVIGGLMAIVGAEASQNMFRGGSALIGALPGTFIAAFGLLMLAVTQNARASVDTAEYTQQMLKVARDQLQISQQSLKAHHTTLKSFAELTPTPSGEPEKTTSFTQVADTDPKSANTHSTHTAPLKIDQRDGRFYVGAIEFQNLEMAREYLERGREKATLPTIDDVQVEIPQELQPLHAVGEMVEYRGKQLKAVEAGYVFKGTMFNSLERAKERIDQDIAEEADRKTAPQLGGVTRT